MVKKATWLLRKKKKTRFAFKKKKNLIPIINGVDYFIIN